MSKNVKQNIKKSLCAHFWTVSVIRKRHFFKTQEQQQRSNIMQQETQKVSLKKLCFKKILPSKKKPLRTLCSDKYPRKQHLELVHSKNSKTIIISREHQWKPKKSTGLVFV